MTDDTMYEALSASIGPLAHLPNNGAAYHTGEQVITALNRVLGPGNWSYEVLEVAFEDDSDEVCAKAELTALINGVRCVRQDYGSQALKRARSTGKFISKGEDRKAAVTDALKRCARLLGVGLDAWENEKAPSWRPEGVEEGAPLAPATTPAAAPGTSASPAARTPSTRPAARNSSSTAATTVPLDQLSIESLRDKLRAGVAAAVQLQLDAQQLIGMAAVDADLVNFSREQLIEKIRTLGAAILEGSQAT